MIWHPDEQLARIRALQAGKAQCMDCLLDQYCIADFACGRCSVVFPVEPPQEAGLWIEMMGRNAGDPQEQARRVAEHAQEQADA